MCRKERFLGGASRQGPPAYWAGCEQSRPPHNPKARAETRRPMPMLTAKLANKNLVEQLGVALALGGLHQWPHEAAEHLLALLGIFLALILGYLIRHTRQNLVDHGLQGACVGHLLQALGFDDGVDIVVLARPQGFEHLLGARRGQGVVGDAGHQGTQLCAGDRGFGYGLFFRIQACGELTLNPVCGQFGIFAVFSGFFEERGQFGVGRKDACVVVVQAVLLLEAGLAGIRQFRQAGAGVFDEGVVDFHRQQVRAGEVAVVVGFFLGANGAGLVPVAVYRRVSWVMLPPSSRMSICRSTSWAMACSMNRKEFRFLVSVRVPRVSEPLGFREMLTSKRMEPWDISPSQMPREVTMLCSFLAKATASSAVFMSGSVTTSISGVPARFRSMPVMPW